MNNNQQKNQHLWWRAGFGPPADQIKQLSRKKPEAIFHSILKASEKKPAFFDLVDPDLKEMVNGESTNGSWKTSRPQAK